MAGSTLRQDCCCSLESEARPMHRCVVPCTFAHSPEHLLSIGRRRRRSPPFVPRVIAVRAGCHDVVRAIQTSFALRHQVLSSATQALEGILPASVCGKLAWGHQPHGYQAVEASAALVLESLKSKVLSS